MSDEPDCYHTYLLRLWRAQCEGRWQWRASLERPSTGERAVFATLDELYNYFNTTLLECQPEADREQAFPKLSVTSKGHQKPRSTP